MIIWIGIQFEDLHKYFQGDVADLLGSIHTDIASDFPEASKNKFKLMVTEEGVGFGKKLSDTHSSSIAFNQLDIEQFEVIFFELENYFDSNFEIEVSIEDMAILFLREDTLIEA